MTKQNALFNEKLNFLINFRSVQINLHKGVNVFQFDNVGNVEERKTIKVKQKWEQAKEKLCKK